MNRFLRFSNRNHLAHFVIDCGLPTAILSNVCDQMSAFALPAMYQFHAICGVLQLRAAKMADVLMKHIFAVKEFLTAVSLAAGFADAVAVQEKVLAERISATALTIETATGVIKALDGLPQSSVQKLTAAVMGRVGSPEVSAASSGNRSVQQDWIHFESYLTEELWGHLKDSRFSQSARLELMLNFAINTGLRNPSEPTFQRLTALYLCVIEKPETASSMEPATRLSTMRSLKACFKRVQAPLAASLPQSPPPLKLPASPSELQVKFPTWWAHAYANEAVPISSQVASLQLSQMAAVIPMRESRSDIRSSNSAPAPLQLNFQSQQPQQCNMLQVMQQMLAMCSKPAAPESQPRSVVRVLSRLQSRLAIEGLEEEGAAGPTAPPAADMQQQPALLVQVPALQGEAQDDTEAAQEPPAKKRLSIEDSTKAMLQAIENKSEPQKEKAKAKSKAKAKAKAEAKQTVNNTANKQVKKTAAKTAPTISWERTRMQIMCRTGFGGAGSSNAIKFEKGKENLAWKKAEQWLKDERKRQGI